MNRHNTLLVTLLSVFALWGCNSDNDDNKQSQVQSGVYSGVIWANDASPDGAQSDGQINFAAASVSCEMSDQELVCSNANGSSALSPVTLESDSITSYADTYQARYSDELYQMSIDQSGAIALT
ncbi:hypothetical protein [Vibrio natriegens]|uniref:hypothetical protein n=1 Tax=Vibrio natriegens TaxID=691 RepID=UPI0020CDB4ED|nr:hypothetical protein [Vibrio natriegens]